LLTPAEAAAFLRLPSVQAYYIWRRRHGIPNRIEGRSVRVYASDLVRPAPASVVDFGEAGRAFARKLAARRA
jgi:hypothetical protein